MLHCPLSRYYNSPLTLPSFMRPMDVDCVPVCHSRASSIVCASSIALHSLTQGIFLQDAAGASPKGSLATSLTSMYTAQLSLLSSSVQQQQQLGASGSSPTGNPAAAKSRRQSSEAAAAGHAGTSQVQKTGAAVPQQPPLAPQPTAGAAPPTPAAAPAAIPRRVLTQPSEGTRNDGFDNENSDLILITGEEMVNNSGTR